MKTFVPPGKSLSSLFLSVALLALFGLVALALVTDATLNHATVSAASRKPAAKNKRTAKQRPPVLPATPHFPAPEITADNVAAALRDSWAPPEQPFARQTAEAALVRGLLAGKWLPESSAFAGEEGAARKRKPKAYDDPDKALQYYLQKRLPEGETELPVERYFEALEEMKQMPLHSTADNRLVSSPEELQALAPAQQRLGEWKELGPGNIGGRTRALLIDPRFPEKMYAGGVAGGVWKTTDAGQSWVPVADQLANIAVNSLAFDPQNFNTVYAGTGEGYNNGDLVRGAGIFKTVDGGQTWARLASTANDFNFYFVNDLVISRHDSNRIYAATATGVWRSLDGGATWARVLATTVNGGCLDLAARTDQTTDFLFASCGNFVQATVYRKTAAETAGAWETVLTEPGMGRTALALAPSNQNVVYAVAASITGAYTHGLHAFFRSSNGGAAGSWTPRVRNTDANRVNTGILSNLPFTTATDCKLGTANSFTGQSWYDLAIAVDPLDENRIWVGGIDIVRSDDGGANWGAAAFAYERGSGGALIYGRADQMHPDIHGFVFSPQYDGAGNQQMFVVNDGGVWRTDNARAAVSTGPRAYCTPAANAVRWRSINVNYGVTQFYHGSVAPDGSFYFGGTQDNGTLRGESDETGTWREILSADGGYSAIDHRNPNILYASTQGAGFYKSSDGGATFSSATLGLSLTAVLFITPLALDPSDPARLYLGGDILNRTENGMSTWTNAGSVRTATLTTNLISAIAIAPTDSNHVLIGANNGFIVRTTRALALNPTAPLSSTLDRATNPRTGYVSWLAYDPQNKNIAYATYSTFGGTHVWKTVNGGETWTGIDGTGTTRIPDIPVHSIVVDTANSQRLYVGTDLGVFVSLDGGATWAVENTGFANAATETLVLNTTGGVTSLYAFTHGRGVFRVATGITSGCNFSLAQTKGSVAAAGGDVTANVNVTPGGCSWSAASNAPWLTVLPGAGGTASGAVNLRAAANTTFQRRFGTVTIAGRSFSVAQEGAPDLDSPTLRITTPNTLTVNTTAGGINVAGTAADNQGIASISWRTDRGASGAVGGAANWTITGVPLVTGRNVITVTATDLAGNVSNTATLTVNAMPASILTTVAGSGVAGFSGDNAQATAAGLIDPWRITFDSGGNMYIADDIGQRVRKVAPNGVITTVAGNGLSGFSGDGGQATAARLNLPSHVAIDADGNLYIADYSNFRVRKVTVATGLISTLAGTGVAGFSGDGGQASAAQLGPVDSVVIGRDGHLYIADANNHRVRRVTLSDGRISTIAGNGGTGLSGDGGQATAAAVSFPIDIAFNSAGDLYIAAGSGHIRKVTMATGVITTVAGNGQLAFNGEGLPALNTAISNPQSLAFDSAGNLYFNDRGLARIRRINAADQIVNTVAGGLLGFSPDGTGAVGGRVNPQGIAINPAGRLLFADTGNARVRAVIPATTGDSAPPVVQITAPTSGAVFAAAGNPLTLSGTATDNNGVAVVRWSNDRGGSGQASGTTAWAVPVVTLQPGVNNLTVTAWDLNGNAGNAYLTVTYTAAQIVTTLAGTGVIADTGDGGPGTAATLFQPRGVAVDSKGNIIVADTQNHRVRRIAPNGVITAFAGTGVLGAGGDGGPAVEATLNFPNFVIVDKDDNVYISDQFAHRIRKVAPDGVITTFAGTGTGFGGFSGDGGPATAARFNGQTGIALDREGNLFVADRLSARVRRIDARTGVITTVAGSGLIGGDGDGGPAVEADLNLPTGVAVDAAGNLYIADTGNQRIRRVTPDGRISTFAGTGLAGFGGDGGPAASALLNLANPATLACDAAGDLYLADRNNHRIRKITLSTGVITTVAGTGVAGFNGDGTAPAATSLSFPSSVAFDAAGNLIIADSGNNRVRRVRMAAGVRAVTNVSAASFAPATGLAPEELAVAFGTNLATGTATGTGAPLPTALAGTTLAVRDNLGVERLAPLIYVSPGQINYLVPSGTASGLATITITNGAGETATDIINITPVAPSLFAANGNGQGVALGYIFRRNAAGQDSFESLARFDAATNRWVAVPIDLGPTGDQVFLVAYGTGFRGRSDLANTRATVGGVTAAVSFAGAVPGLLGLDQANLRLERSLLGRGEVDVVFTVDGRTANVVRVMIK